MSFTESESDVAIIIKLRKKIGTYSQRKIRKERILRGIRNSVTPTECGKIAETFAKLMTLSDEVFEGNSKIIRTFLLTEDSENDKNS